MCVCGLLSCSYIHVQEFSAHVEDSSEALYDEMSKQDVINQPSTEPINEGAPPSEEETMNEEMMEQGENGM